MSAGGARPPAGLRGEGQILLVSCYELGHAPHGLALPLAFLERAGFRPAAFDLAVGEVPAGAVETARLIAISVPMHTALRLALRLARTLRAQNPDAHLCFFGLYAALHADTLRSLGGASVLAGEVEEELVRLAERLDRGDAHAEPTSVVLERLRFPEPSRRALRPPEAYAHLETAAGRVPAGYTETSRGCRDLCGHCPVPAIYRGRFFVVPAEVVLADVAAQVEAGARHITFGDPDFLNGPGHGRKILRELARRFPGLSFDLTAQVTHLLRDPAILPELVELGCAFVVTAAESLSDRVLARIGKRHRRADFERLLALTREAGLVLRPTFIPFTPWTELLDLRDLVDFIAREEIVLHVDPVQLTVRLLVPPGSLLLEREAARTAFGPLDPEALTHTWVHADPRVDELQRVLAARVERAAERAEDPAETFAAARAEVYRALSLAPPARAPRPRRWIPRLTEPWFC